MNPVDYLSWKYTSLPYYISDIKSEWVHPERILELFNNSKEYLDFLKDYEEQKEIMAEIKDNLADS